MRWFVLCDLDAAYVGFCQLFEPEKSFLEMPLGVLSNNQGNVIARNRPMKDLGVAMGAPYYQCKSIIERFHGHVWGPNFELFGDMSDRFHTELAYLLIEPERYSVDEAFGQLLGTETEVKEIALDIQKTIKKNLGLRCGVGVARTRTLAKLASACAKDKRWRHKTQGVAVLGSAEQIDWALARFEPTDIWGIGSRLAKRLRAHGVASALDVKNLSHNIAKLYPLPVKQTIAELNGKCVIDPSNDFTERQQICFSRTTGSTLMDISELRAALSNHVFSACSKLRSQQGRLGANTVNVHIGTNAFADNPQYHNGLTVKLAQPTDSTKVISKAAFNALDNIFKPGFKYRRVGVILGKLSPIDIQPSLLNPIDQDKTSKALDQINARFGREAIKLGWVKEHQAWRVNSDLAPPSYTTNLSQLPRVK